MNIKNTVILLANVIGGYLFSFLFAYVIESWQNIKYPTSIGWTWEHRHHEALSIHNYMIYGLVFYLLIEFTFFMFILKDKKSNKI